MTIIEVTYSQRRELLKATEIENRFVFLDDKEWPGDFMIWPLENIRFRAVRKLNATQAE